MYQRPARNKMTVDFRFAWRLGQHKSFCNRSFRHAMYLISMQGGQSRYRYRSRLRKRHVVWLHGQSRVCMSRVLYRHPGAPAVGEAVTDHRPLTFSGLADAEPSNHLHTSAGNEKPQPQSRRPQVVLTLRSPIRSMCPANLKFAIRNSQSENPTAG